MTTFGGHSVEGDAVPWRTGPELPPPAPALDRILEPALSSAPDSPALVVRREDGTTLRLTYRELDDEVAARMGALRAAGVRPGDAVLLVAARVPGLVPAVLALLRLGAAYVPVDPGAPDAHWRRVAAAVGAAALIGPQAAISRAGSALPDDILLIDVDAPVAGRPAEPARVGLRVDKDRPVEESATAYVLFTSGSTGEPKGVIVSHGNVVHRVASYLSLSEGPCRYLLHGSLCFDGAVGGMFSTLARAGCLVQVPDPVAGDPGLVAQAVRDERITHLEPVPSWYATLLDVARPDDLVSVRVVILGGEVLPPALVAASRRALPDVRLFNDYGPTEVTVAATVFEVPPDWSGADVPIGRPHANTAVAVVDEHLRPVPDGEVGELWVAGPCVAEGYLGLPDHPSFAPDPSTGGRGYRTGDLVRRDADGLLHFCGRRDRQVKVRGQRIEPEEVEAVLGGLPGVAAAAVEVDETGSEPRLIAYVSPLPGAELTSALVSALLAERLPVHLRPAVVLVLAELPLTPGGKVDRRALPPVPRAGAALAAGAPPRDGTERLVVEAFAAVLGADVDRDTDFFAAGGQSLGAARVVARLREATGVEIRLSDLTGRRTPAALAAALRDGRVATPELPLRRRSRPVGEVWRVPAAPRQESFWYLEHVVDGAGRSNLVELLTFPAGTDPARLRTAVQALVERHAALRTGLELAADGLYQVVVPRVVPQLVDLPPAVDARALDALADAFAAEPFDLAHPPLLRAGLTAGPDGPTLVLVVHHAVADGWSLGVMVEDLVALVRSGGDVAAIPEPAVEYVDLTEWTAERDQARREAAVEHLTPLLFRAADADRILPYDRPASAQPELRAGVATTRLPAETLDRVAALARSLGTTVYSVLAASFGALLALSSGRSEVVLTAPLSGRGDPALDRVVGCCINTRLVPVDVSGAPTFAEIVRRVAANAAAGEPHEWLPLEVPLRELAEGVRANAGPVLFNLLEAQSGDLDVDGASVRRRSRPGAMAYSQLDMYLEHRDGGLSVEAVYPMQRFDHGTIEALLERWSELVASALEDPGRPASGLPLVTGAEDARLALLEGDPGELALPGVLDDVRARLAEDPQAVAVIDAGGPWTRAELWDRAGAVAALLGRRGVRPGSRVLVALDETGDAVAALLACWRAGAVPVPVGENQPGSRLDVVARVAGAALVLDRATLDAMAPGAPVDDVPAADGGAAAYVLFTSGSTGEPKGVVVGHRALAASTRARVAAYPARPAVALVAHDLAFDAALGIIAWYLATGGTLVMARHDQRLDPQSLARLIRRHGVGQLDIVPSHYRLLLDLADPADLATLELVTLGGEACPPALVAAHMSALPGVGLVNEYGPTESTVWALAHTCTEADRTGGRVPIGTPIQGVTARVGNAHGQRVPLGAEGELLLGGHLLADGYLGDPARTAEKFVERSGRRWYRTGDRARWSTEGAVEFLGRLDAQLKVRGFRIEPDEVETVLAGLDGVARAAVGVAELVAGEPVLVGWVQLAPEAAAGGEHTSARLRARLMEQLPEWLVPSVVVLVEELPETSAGKIDRARLPDPVGGLQLAGSPPSTATEEHVAAVWRELLGRPVAADQSFFALGGQSLLAARMVARLREELDVAIELRDVLAAPRVRDIAALVDAGRNGRPPAPDGIPTPRSEDEWLDAAQVEDLLARMDELDDDEVEGLLIRLGEQ